MKMKSSRSLAAVLVSSTALIAPGLSIAILSAPTMAAAQAAPAPAKPASNATEVQEVVVTGTLFRTKVETAAPVTVLSQQSITNAGITTISDAVRSISADNSGTIPTAFGIGFAAGSSGIALRGLTVNSTIVLIDGFRTANYALADDGVRGFVDLNTIPESIVDHVDVLKDGASAIYGADAIGGVVNIVMKPTFQGEEVEAEAGTSQHGGGSMERFAGTVGYGNLDTDRFNAYFNVEYQHDDPIHVGQRGFPFNTTDLTSIGGNNPGNGQPGVPSGSIYGSVAPIDPTTGAQVGGAQILNPAGCGSRGKLSTQTDSLGFTDTYCAQNLSLNSDDQPRETRYGFYGRFTVQINPNTTAYLNASYYQNDVFIDTSRAQINQYVPYNTSTITLPAHLSNGSLNPNDPFAAQGYDAQINYAFGDIPSSSTENNHVFRSVLDLRGSAYGWDYETTGIIAHTWLDTVNRGFINYNQLLSDIADGSYSFVNPSSNSAAVRAALSPTDAKTSTTDLDGINLQATHALTELPGGPLNLALGAAWRYEATYDPDLNPLVNGNAEYNGFGDARTIGNRTVTSAFAELDAPVIKQVDIDIAGRFDHYSDAGNNFSPKIGLKWTPIRQLLLRATYSEGFRAPSFAENGNSFFEGFAGETLPSSYVTAHGNDGYVQPYFIGTAASGNPHLKPEKSQNFTVGMVVQPISSISLTLDYYHIQKTQVIAQGNPSVVLADYFAGLPLPAGSSVTVDTPDPAHPNLLPKPLVVYTPYTNANKIMTDGLDLDILFKHDLPYDFRLTSDFNITDIFHFNYTEPGQPTYNYVGTQSPYALSSGAGTPKWRWNWQTTLSHGPLSVTATVKYVSSIKMVAYDYGGSACFSTVNGANFPANCTSPSFTDVDLHIAYDVNPKIQVYGDVQNLMDAKPPFDPLDYAGVNYNPTYAQDGIIGRYFKLGVRAKF
ncbi:MAG: TonB-dependent receptor [Caulobacteraceae bacterium]|nr:TonB-dependent receptor [Caulobacteraceae bacterium]